ncbi:MAG TPA: hypothetical protein VN231_01195 [Allosphingosinicella sp.]|nr:hypothetical protein [Allosphingosinicella sp.]
MPGIDWPRPPLRLRRADVRLAGLAAAAGLILVVATGGAAVFVGTSAPIRQEAANTLATLGAGETLEGARLERRHAAALALAPATVDRLLRQCRSMTG